MSTSASLNQDEIDLLFGGGDDEAQAVAQQGLASDVQVYDFRRPARISKDRKRSLTAMYGLLGKSIESWITGRVRDQIEVDLQSVEQLTFGEFVLALPSPCASYIVEVPGTGRQGVIDFGHEFAYFIVDRLLGGAGQHTVPARSLSAIERLVVRIVADRVAAQTTDVWKDYVSLDLDVSGFESIPEMLQVANREDPVLVANLGVTMGDMSSLLLLCLPFASLEKFFTGSSSRRPEQSAGDTEERARNRGKIETTLRDARIPVGARLPSFQMTLHELASLKPGGIFSTGLPPTTELELYVAGQRRFTGVPGRVGQSLAVQVLDHVAPDPEDLIDAGREVPLARR